MEYLEGEDFNRKTYVSTQDVAHKLQRYRCCGDATYENKSKVFDEILSYRPWTWNVAADKNNIPLKNKNIYRYFWQSL